MSTADPLFHIDQTRRPDYASLDLDGNDADDRIIGEVIAFAHHAVAATVELLTLDTGMRIRAHSHKVVLVADTERFDDCHTAA